MDKALNTAMGWGFWFGLVTGVTLAVVFYYLSAGSLYSLLMIPLGILMGIAQGYFMPREEEP
ncbi:MAG: hypothetical protein PWQ88_644 [Candidatus Methanomethylophilaceae archaeon]|nr:hypothetical protein [Candidatus Methanomethylophilaceae archaeon]MDI3542265.1 hypothetical protein [Candidatus Methanomethylophilaceae archaeon]